jgi:hypothetical protein
LASDGVECVRACEDLSLWLKENDGNLEVDFKEYQLQQLSCILRKVSASHVFFPVLQRAIWLTLTLSLTHSLSL